MDRGCTFKRNVVDVHHSRAANLANRQIAVTGQRRYLVNIQIERTPSNRTNAYANVRRRPQNNAARRADLVSCRAQINGVGYQRDRTVTRSYRIVSRVQRARANINVHRSVRGTNSIRGRQTGVLVVQREPAWRRDGSQSRNGIVRRAVKRQLRTRSH